MAYQVSESPESIWIRNAFFGYKFMRNDLWAVIVNKDYILNNGTVAFAHYAAKLDFWLASNA